MPRFPGSRLPLARPLAAALALGLALAGCRRGGAGADGGPRVVSLAPSLTEIVCAVGAADRLVGRSSADDYPPEVVRRVPVVGDFGRPSLERILAVRPSLVLEVDLEDETFVRQLAQLGIRCVHVPCDRLDDIPAAIRQVGGLLDRAAAADTLAASIEQGLVARRAAPPPRRAPAVYAEIWNDPLMTVGAGSFIDELIRLAGGRNIGGASGREYFRIASEWIVAQDPGVILCLYQSPGGDAAGRVGRRPGWADVRAVREGRVYGGLDNDLLLRPGPRVLEGLHVLERCFAGAEGERP